MSEKRECKALYYIRHFFIFIPAVSGCVSISAFASLVNISVGTTSSAVGSKTCAITREIKSYQTIFTKKKRKKDHIVLLAKTKLNWIEVFISKVLIDLYINHDEIVLVNNMSRECNEIK